MNDRIYIDADEARITYTGGAKVRLELIDGRVFEDLEPRRLFPLSGLDKYITLLNSDMKEIAIIRRLDTIIPESRQAIEKCLDEYYLIPKITHILERIEKSGILRYRVMTDLGERTIEIRNRNSDIKALFDGRILMRDSDDNRYEIPDIAKIDKRSFQLINSDL